MLHNIGVGEYRLERLGCLIQEKIGALIVEGRIKDPGVDSFLTVTRVSVSRDLSYADVYVSSYKSPQSLKKGVEALQRAAGFIQSRLQMRVRQTPRLRFYPDEGIREGFELIQKIEELNSDGGE
jgi:ribosome-binding factor A